MSDYKITFDCEGDDKYYPIHYRIVSEDWFDKGDAFHWKDQLNAREEECAKVKAELEEFKRTLREVNLHESYVGLVAAIEGARLCKFERDKAAAERDQLRAALLYIHQEAREAIATTALSANREGANG